MLMSKNDHVENLGNCKIVQILGRIGGAGRRRIRRGVIAGQLGAINLACTVCVCVSELLETCPFVCVGINCCDATYFDL